MASPMWIRDPFSNGILHNGLVWDGSGRILSLSTLEGAPSSSSVYSSSIWNFLSPPPSMPITAECAWIAWKAAPPVPFWAGTRPVLYYTGAAGDEGLADLAKNAKAPLCVSGSIDDVASATDALAKAVVTDMLVSPGSVRINQGLHS